MTCARFFRAARYSAIFLYRLGETGRGLPAFAVTLAMGCVLKLSDAESTILPPLALCTRAKAKYMPLLVPLQRPVFTEQAGFIKNIIALLLMQT